MPAAAKERQRAGQSEPAGGRDERAAAGKAARARVPLESQAEFRPAPGRDPVGLLVEQGRSRIPDLVPVRHGLMLVSPFTFFRGAALPMAADLAATPDTGLRVQLCGDAHLPNFGAFGSPERRLILDVNDFDETLPGPFEWDVKRLAASLVVAGQDNGFSAKQSRRVATAATARYRTAMREFAGMPMLDVWYARLDVDDAIARFRSQLKKQVVKKSEATAARARTRDSAQALAKLTRVVDGDREIISDPPLIVPLEDLPAGAELGPGYAALQSLVGDYVRTLPPDRQHLVGQFRLIRVARKVVGVGSVGTQAWILLLEAHGSLLMQAASDIFLGWQTITEADGTRTDYYLRQLRDWKYSLPIEQLNPDVMGAYCGLCGWTLARAHARTGDRDAIAAYLGGSDRFEQAVTDFAVSYADQTVRDHAALAEAVASGRVPARTGV